MASNSSSPPDKRRRRTQAEIDILEAQIYAVLHDDHPQSVRHVFYRMTNPRIEVPVEKSENGYQQIQHRITQMRRKGMIPYGWITDATRRGYYVNTYTSAAEFIETMAGDYRADLWRQSEHYVEVWCESRSIAGVIESTCEELAVSLYPAGGFSSISLVHQAAQYINLESEDGKKPAQIIYIGDHDPAGVLIDKSLNSEFYEHLSPNVKLNLHRIAITPEQIEQYDLPTKPRKNSDRRALHITETVEAEAMPANQLRSLLRASVEQYLPTGALSAVKAAEESERAGLLAIANVMRASSTGKSPHDNP